MFSKCATIEAHCLYNRENPNHVPGLWASSQLMVRCKMRWRRPGPSGRAHRGLRALPCPGGSTALFPDTLSLPAGIQNPFPLCSERSLPAPSPSLITVRHNPSSSLQTRLKVPPLDGAWASLQSKFLRPLYFKGSGLMTP